MAAADLSASSSSLSRPPEKVDIRTFLSLLASKRVPCLERFFYYVSFCPGPCTFNHSSLSVNDTSHSMLDFASYDHGQVLSLVSAMFDCSALKTAGTCVRLCHHYLELPDHSQPDGQIFKFDTNLIPAEKQFYLHFSMVLNTKQGYPKDCSCRVTKQPVQNNGSLSTSLQSALRLDFRFISCKASELETLAKRFCSLVGRHLSCTDEINLVLSISMLPPVNYILDYIYTIVPTVALWWHGMDISQIAEDLLEGVDSILRNSSSLQKLSLDLKDLRFLAWSRRVKKINPQIYFQRVILKVGSILEGNNTLKHVKIDLGWVCINHCSSRCVVLWALEIMSKLSDMLKANKTLESFEWSGWWNDPLMRHDWKLLRDDRGLQPVEEYNVVLQISKDI